MTMILTCLAKNFIVQASDRRLTRRKGKTIEVTDEHSNKALVYSNHFAFAYTGLAELDDRYPSAIDWAAQQLSEKENLKDAVIHLGCQAAKLMNSDRIRNMYSGAPESIKGLAFVGAGFATVVHEDGRKSRWPLRIVVSNFFKDGTWLPQPLSEFVMHFHRLPENCDFELFVAGQSLPGNRKTRLTNLLARCFQGKVSPETIGRLLTREIQATAAQNTRVGKNIMCTFVPREYSDSVKYHHIGGILMNPPVPSTGPQRLTPAVGVSDWKRFAILPPFDDPRCVYIDGKNKTFSYYTPVYVGPEYVRQPMSILEMEVTIPGFIADPSPHTDSSP